MRWDNNDNLSSWPKYAIIGIANPWDPKMIAALPLSFLFYGDAHGMQLNSADQDGGTDSQR